MKVIINVYDIQRSCNQKGADFFGVGIYHTGIEIDGLEYAYGGNTTIRGTGVYQIYPRQHHAFLFKYSIELGHIPDGEFLKAEKKKEGQSLNFNQHVWPVINELSDKYRAYKYDLLTMNCNHFSDDLVRRLFVDQQRLPNYINRAAWLGSWFHCIIPTRYVQVTPPGCEEEAAILNEKWRQEDEMEAQKQKKQGFNGKGKTLTELETEMSERGVIDKFYTSINSSMTPKGDQGDDDMVDSGVSSEDDDEDTEQDELVHQISSISKRKPKKIQEEGGVPEKKQGYFQSLFNPFGYLNYYTQHAAISNNDEEN